MARIPCALALVLALLALLGCARAQEANCASALSLIEQAEGFRACTYVDTTGHKTICYGFNLDNAGAEQKVEAVGGNWDSVYNHGGCLTQEQCTELLQSEVDSASAAANRVFGVQCSCIQAVLVDMTYNLGEAGIESFTTFDSYIRAHEWASAADDLKGTLWCRQVGNRCTRDTEIISQGCQATEEGAAPSTHSSAPSVPVIAGICVGLVALVALVALAAIRYRRTRTWEVVALLDDKSVNYGASA